NNMNNNINNNMNNNMNNNINNNINNNVNNINSINNMSSSTTSSNNFHGQKNNSVLYAPAPPSDKDCMKYDKRNSAAMHTSEDTIMKDMKKHDHFFYENSQSLQYSRQALPTRSHGGIHSKTYQNERSTNSINRLNSASNVGSVSNFNIANDMYNLNNSNYVNNFKHMSNDPNTGPGNNSNKGPNNNPNGILNDIPNNSPNNNPSSYFANVDSSNSRTSSNVNMKKEENCKSNTCNINVDGRERLQNDYNQNFVNTGERPQNFIRDSDENKRFTKYPKLKQLLELKNIIIKKRSTPARYISCDLRTFELGSLDIKFDVILIDPPWKEYYDRKIHNLDILNNMHIDNYDLNNDINDEKDKYWSLDDIGNLEIEKIAEIPSFLFLWCGVTHLEDARILLNRWGYRRCEDICWLKTNINEKNKKIKYLNEINNENSYLQRTTEHCLVGIKGAVRRSYDIHLIHANLDTDVIIAEETDENIYNNNKPEELYKIIEKFCLGRRKIELFGTNRNIRNGWLTLGKNMDTTLFNKEEYISWFEGDIAWPEATSYVGGKYMGTTSEIENLRPKSPPRNANG
ncbi:mRNA methyltransferase, putative, partial [Plasmodium malariae]